MGKVAQRNAYEDPPQPKAGRCADCEGPKSSYNKSPFCYRCQRKHLLDEESKPSIEKYRPAHALSAEWVNEPARLEERIMRAVCAHYCLVEAVLQLNRREHVFAQPRNVASYLLAHDAKLNIAAVALHMCVDKDTSGRAIEIIERNAEKYAPALEAIRSLIQKPV